MRTIALAAATALAVAAPAFATSAVKDPSTLILLKKDFPAQFNYDRSGGDAVGWPEILAPLGVKSAKQANYGAVTINSKFKSLEMIIGTVVTTASAQDATKAFAIVAKKKQSPEYKPVSGVPQYGDQQSVTYSAPGKTVQLLVRKRSVLWYLRVSGLPLSDLLGEVKTYAAIQKKKVGTG